MDTAVVSHDSTDRHFPRGRELAGIVAFWTVFAALNVTNWLFPPGSGDGPPITARGIGIGVFDSVLWMVATPAIFWLASRYSIESASRAKRIAMYLVAGILAALVIDLAIEAMRTYFSGPPPQQRFHRNEPSGRRLFAFARIRFVNEYMVFLAVLVAGVARDYFRRYQRRVAEEAALRAQLAEARLTVLQSQLNPHFLFNTLNAVATLVDRDPRGVRRMISRLSDLLRATLEPSADPEVPVSREVSLTERYLDILSIRFQGTLTTSIDAPGDVRDALVPPLILQPLIENAMKHAVSRTSEPSRIDVRIREIDGALELSVADTGAQGNPASVEEIESGGAGIGLANARARLEQLYGDAQSLVLAPNDLGGTTVTIRLPFHTSGDLRATPVGGA